MRRLLYFASIFVSVISLSCPDQFQLMEGKCIRPLFLNKPFVIETDLQPARVECARDGAHLPIIKDDKENTSFQTIVNKLVDVPGRDYWLVMDLACNATRRLEWADGTPVIYKGPSWQFFDYDCLNTHYTVMDRVNWGSETWQYIGLADGNPKVVLCVVDGYQATSPAPTTTAPTTPHIPMNCPYLYQEMEGKCIRPLRLQQPFNIRADLPGARRECAMDGGHLPIIKSDDENAIFNKITENNFAEIAGRFNFLVLDFVCNNVTTLLEWADGTPVQYQGPLGQGILSPHFHTIDCVRTGDTVVSRPVYNDWLEVATDNYQDRTVLCVIDDHKVTHVDPLEEQCGGYEIMSNPAEKPCYKLFKDEIQWDAADLTCAQVFGSLVRIDSAEENKYFWRTGTSSGNINMMYIGAHQSTHNSSQWEWINEGVTFDGKIYDNFLDGFPFQTALNHVGECTVMIMSNTSAQWTNHECSDRLPFICRRIDYSTLPKSCPDEAPIAGNDIFPPGFPHSDTSCAYELSVTANKLVELEIITLIAEDNKDFLEIHEGPDDTNLIASLTGSILSSTKFTTVKSNVMRVNWKPSGTGYGRGFRIRYKEVDAS